MLESKGPSLNNSEGTLKQEASMKAELDSTPEAPIENKFTSNDTLIATWNI